VTVAPTSPRFSLPSSLPRRSMLLGLVAAPLTVAACSGDKKKPATPSSSSSSTTTTTPAPAKAAVTGKGLPKDLLAVMGALYLGGKVPATGTVASALSKRRTVKTSVGVSGTTGRWMGSTVASIVHGKDVTLLVKGASSWSVVGGWWPSLSVYRPPFPTMRVLAVGSDARTGQPVEKCRGDALHIIGVDHKGVGGMVGIPRDSWVPLSTGGNAKVNAALVFGGPKALVRTIEQASGVQIDGYVITGFKGFRGMVDSLGGIIFVAKQSLRSVDNFQIVKAGTNKLTSKTALALARERKHLPNGDFGRSANQGELIKAGMVMAQKLGPAQLARLLGLMGPHLATSLTPAEVLNLCASLYLSDAAKVSNKVVPGAIGTRDGQSVVLLGTQAHSTFADMKDGRLGA
jgi:LCP family protein required for cell wall assembly